ncbi:hypothetical protein ENSA7_46790 [Enhygromyxa salina]|uniref:Uncharacterized protein n=1 Tax=Enhygromyxa salina TaxID=215803 RepID=A0A2S9YJF3_9BACT|nr:hypothetical protein ENSA7_46790 [Enhygromyxa salina]
MPVLATRPRGLVDNHNTQNRAPRRGHDGDLEIDSSLRQR